MIFFFVVFFLSLLYKKKGIKVDEFINSLNFLIICVIFIFYKARVFNDLVNFNFAMK